MRRNSLRLATFCSSRRIVQIALLIGIVSYAFFQGRLIASILRDVPDNKSMASISLDKIDSARNYVPKIVEVEGKEVKVVATSNARYKAKGKLSLALSMFKGEPKAEPIDNINRIYYINKDDSPVHRAIMEDWLSEQPIPYERVPAVEVAKEDNATCVNGKRDEGLCKQVAGNVLSNLAILEAFKTGGYTLVLEDRFVITEMAKLIASVASVPSDWDILRWDCRESPKEYFEMDQLRRHTKHFKWYSNNVAFSTNIDNSKCLLGRCNYCGGAHAYLIRSSSVERLKQLWSKIPYDSVDCALSSSDIKSYCINIGVGEFRQPVEEVPYEATNSTLLIEQAGLGIYNASFLPVVKRDQMVVFNHIKRMREFKARGLDHIRKVVEEMENPGPPVSIERIYYINMDHRLNRRSIMESWLSKQSIPYERVGGAAGSPYDCVPQRNGGARCVGITGLINSNLKIMDSYNTSGYTLVLEDDWAVKDMEKALAAVQLLPSDWDVIRYDCWGPPLKSFKFFGGRMAYSTTIDHRTCPSGDCEFSSGTHMVLWKSSSVDKLRQVWSRIPYDDIDTRLTDPLLKSYCIDVDVGEFRQPKNERSDIPKREAGNQ